ncbi:MAG: energy transducer TonB, partial [Bacteroidales bacterium]
VYPSTAWNKGIQGTLYITFAIEKNGEVTRLIILRGIGGGCDEEALRVVSLMPKWKPGTRKGIPIRVQFNMPIRFIKN